MTVAFGVMTANITTPKASGCATNVTINEQKKGEKMSEPTFRGLVFVAIIVMWVAPFAISSVKQARRERSRANHPTAHRKH